MSLSWINRTINPKSSFSPSTSWILQVGGYSAVFFVWENLDNPNALFPPVEIKFTVKEIHQVESVENEN